MSLLFFIAFAPGPDAHRSSFHEGDHILLILSRQLDHPVLGEEVRVETAIRPRAFLRGCRESRARWRSRSRAWSLEHVSEERRMANRDRWHVGQPGMREDDAGIGGDDGTDVTQAVVDEEGVTGRFRRFRALTPIFAKRAFGGTPTEVSANWLARFSIGPL